MKQKSTWVGIATCLFLAAACIGIVKPGNVRAENDALDYMCPPAPGTLIGFYHDYMSGNNVYSDGHKTGEDFNFSGNVGVFRFAHFMDVGPLTIDPTILIPTGHISADGGDLGNQNLSSSGLGDMVLASGFWFIKDPQKKFWAAYSQYITMPTGEYSNTKALNFGANRWSFREELGFVKGLDNGIFLSGVANVEYFLDNDDYGANSVTQEKDPLYTLEGHLAYNISPACFVSADYYYHFGGETTIAGAAQDDEAGDHLAQLSVGFWLNQNYQLLIKYRTPLKTENGVETNVLGVRFIYYFQNT